MLDSGSFAAFVYQERSEAQGLKLQALCVELGALGWGCRVEVLGHRVEYYEAESFGSHLWRAAGDGFMSLKVLHRGSGGEGVGFELLAPGPALLAMSG